MLHQGSFASVVSDSSQAEVLPMPGDGSKLKMHGTAE